MRVAIILFCIAFGTAYAGISNQQPTHLHVQARSAAKHVTSKKYGSISESSSSSSSSLSSSESVAAAADKELPIKHITQLVIRNPKPAKKTHSKTSKNLKRGRRGLPGKKGKRGKKGKKGEKGDPGESAIGAFSSAIANNQANLAAGEMVKSFTQTNTKDVSYNPSTGQFTAEVGPGHYEIHYGANWSGNGVIALYVNGVEIPSTANLTWARETIIINATDVKPTFTLGNSGGAKGPITYSSAFLTIKKVQ